MMESKPVHNGDQLYEYNIVVTKYEPDQEDETPSSNTQDGPQEPIMLKEGPLSDNISIVFLDPKKETELNDFSIINKECESVDILNIFDENESDNTLKDKFDYVVIKDEIDKDIVFDVDINEEQSNNNLESKDNNNVCTTIVDTQKKINIDDNNMTEHVLSKCINNLEQTKNVDSKIQTKSKVHKCDICSKEFRRITTLKTHMMIHKNPSAFTCEICNRNYTTAGNLKCHLVTHTDEKPYDCSICKLKFNHLSNYKRHFKKHSKGSEEKLYKCEYCDKSYTTLYNLQLHQRIHTGDKPYKCDICGKASARLDNLKKHIQFTHYNCRDFKCNVCQKAFKERSHLKRHMNTHGDRRPYKCDKCERAYKDRSDMNKHRRMCK